MKFLIIRFSSLGDVVLTTPLARCIKNQLPDVELQYLVKPNTKVAVMNNPYINKVHLLEEDQHKTIEKLQKESFDYVIDLQRNLTSRRIKNRLKLPAFSVKKLNFRKLMYTKLKWNVMPANEHVVDRYFKTISPFGVYNDGAGLDYFILPEDEVKEQDIPTSHLAGYIGVTISASFYTKKLPIDKLRELCIQIDHPIILLGGAGEASLGEELRTIDPGKIYNACGKFSVSETADLIRRAKLIIAYDCSLMQIAAAFKKQIITIWGSTTPSLGTYPYYGANFLSYQSTQPSDDIQVHNLWCRPCTKKGRSKCPQGHFNCMKKISIAEIVMRTNARLGR